jgi:hypothetical protein
MPIVPILRDQAFDPELVEAKALVQARAAMGCSSRAGAIPRGGCRSRAMARLRSGHRRLINALLFGNPTVLEFHFRISFMNI